MWSTICSEIVILTLLAKSFGQQMVFRLERENTAINDHVVSIVNVTSDSQISCFLNCLNHKQCCFVQIKEIVDKWICSFFPLLADLSDSKEVANSNIFSVDNGEKCVKRECFDWFQLGFKADGIYDIVVNQKTTKVFCDMTNEGGGWTVVQRRINGAIDFQRTWDEYKNGFGDFAGDYWLGNELIYQMTKNKKKALIRIKATSFDGVTEYVTYKGFWIEDETKKYKMHTGVFEGGNETLSSDWLHHNGMSFTTKDRDNDMYYTNCAVQFSGGWWYRNCYYINPNNRFSSTENIGYGKGMMWKSWKTHYKALKHFSVSLKIIP